MAPTYTLSDVGDLCRYAQSDSINDPSIRSALNTLKLKKTEYITRSNEKYSIIKYEKRYLIPDMVKSTGLCRSLIFKNGKLLVFSPPKSVSYTTFQNESIESDIYAQEFIEGTMINLFFDQTLGDDGEWEIATRSTVGANVSFYQESHTKTFRTMFLEASNHVKLDLDKLPKEYCYSFVLQHPNNRIVKPIMEPMLYLVAVYSISNSVESDIFIEEVPFTLDYITKETDIKTPMNYKYNLTELVDKYASMNTSYDVVGFILKNSKTGARCKFRNPVYEEVRYLRGNQPKLLFQYLSLRQQGRVKNYLKYYSEHRVEFSQMRQRVHNFTEALHNNYLRYYVYKEMSLNECPYQYRSHIGVLHNQYLYNLRENRQHVSRKYVIDYVNALPPAKLMFSLNYHLRKQNVGFMEQMHVTSV